MSDDGAQSKVPRVSFLAVLPTLVEQICASPDEPALVKGLCELGRSALMTLNCCGSTIGIDTAYHGGLTSTECPAEKAAINDEQLEVDGDFYLIDLHETFPQQIAEDTAKMITVEMENAVDNLLSDPETQRRFHAAQLRDVSEHLTLTESGHKEMLGHYVGRNQLAKLALSELRSISILSEYSGRSIWDLASENNERLKTNPFYSGEGSKYFDFFNKGWNSVLKIEGLDDSASIP